MLLSVVFFETSFFLSSLPRRILFVRRNFKLKAKKRQKKLEQFRETFIVAICYHYSPPHNTTPYCIQSKWAIHMSRCVCECELSSLCEENNISSTTAYITYAMAHSFICKGFRFFFL